MKEICHLIIDKNEALITVLLIGVKSQGGPLSEWSLIRATLYLYLCVGKINIITKITNNINCLSVSLDQFASARSSRAVGVREDVGNNLHLSSELIHRVIRTRKQGLWIRRGEVQLKQEKDYIITLHFLINAHRDLNNYVFMKSRKSDHKIGRLNP